MAAASPPVSSPRVALITGGSAGLGRTLVESLAARGWSIVTDGRHAGRLNEAALAAGEGVIAVPGDVTDAGHREALAAAVEQLGRLDLLVNNASTIGTSPMPKLAELAPDEFAHVLETNVVAPMALAARVLEQLRAVGGTVVNITSDAAVEPYEGWGAYGASKAALEHASAILAAEEPSITVVSVDPGDMRTGLHQAAFPGEDISDRPSPAASLPGLLALIDAPENGRHRIEQAVA